MGDKIIVTLIVILVVVLLLFFSKEAAPVFIKEVTQAKNRIKKLSSKKKSTFADINEGDILF